MCADKNEISLTLNNMEELFAEPAADPFDPDSRYLSGIDEVVGKMRLNRRGLYDMSRLLIRLPQTAVNSETQSTIKAALVRYCAAKIAENQQIIDELRVVSSRQMISAFVIAAVLILLTLFLVNFIPGLQKVSGAIAGFVGISVWVVLWDPVYNYVYAWRPNRLDIRIFEKLRAADLLVETL